MNRRFCGEAPNPEHERSAGRNCSGCGRCRQRPQNCYDMQGRPSFRDRDVLHAIRACPGGPTAFARLVVICEPQSVIIRHMTRTALIIQMTFMLFWTAPLAAQPQHSPGTRDEWFRIEFDGQPVGYESLTTMPVRSAASETADSRHGLVRRVRDTRIKLRRFGNDVSVSAHLETVETTDGLLQSWSLRRTSADGSLLQRTGVWNTDNTGFDLTETSAGTSRSELLPANVHPRSAILPAWMATASRNSQKLWTSPVLFPETAAIADIEIHQAGAQSLQTGEGKTIQVTRIDYWPTNSPEMKSSVFYDDREFVVRIEQPLMGQTLRLERTDAAGAFGAESLQGLDLQFRGALPLRKAPQKLDQGETLRLKLTVGTEEQISLSSSDFQVVEQTAANELIITLTRPVLAQADDPGNVTSRRGPRIDPVFTDSSRWINSDNEDLKRMAIIAAGSTSLPAEKCRRLTQHVWKHMRFSPFSTSLQPATTVAKNFRGDCTEHAVLLATLLRCQGIPSRVVVGFVIVPQPESLVPHMWTEALIDGKWMPLDSTRGPDRVGLTHLKVADSALSDEVGSGTVLFIPLLDFLGRATVDVVADEAKQ